MRNALILLMLVGCHKDHETVYVAKDESQWQGVYIGRWHTPIYPGPYEEGDVRGVIGFYGSMEFVFGDDYKCESKNDGLFIGTMFEPSNGFTGYYREDGSKEKIDAWGTFEDMGEYIFSTFIRRIDGKFYHAEMELWRE